MFVIKEQFTKEEVARFDTFERAEQYCGKVAYAENYGMLRTWKMNGKTYMDCGPRTFTIEEVED